MSSSVLYSYHTFMFPFVLENQFVPERSKWGEAKKFEIKSPRDFNEYNYFYPYVQKVLYQREEESAAKYFEYTAQLGTYVITCKQGNFTLEVDGISLRLFSTDVGILSFNLKNTKHSKPQDILAINDFGRRIYPAFLGDDGTKTPKENFLAESIALKIEGQEELFEDFSYFDDMKRADENPDRLPKFISALLGEEAKIRPIIDDRMFVLSFCMNDAITSQLGDYENNDWWYRYLFIDGNAKTCQSKKMMQSLLQHSTYDRWLNDGTLFGISRYSFVCVTSFGAGFLLTHMQTMYFQMVTLLLAYRASILKFAHEVTEISKDPDNKIKDMMALHEQYLKFINHLFFREVTAQEQGIELFDKAMSIMNIEKSLKDLQSDIAELHAFADLKNEKRRQKSLDKIGKIGAYVLVPTLIAGIFGMNTLDDGWFKDNNLLWTLGIIVISGILAFVIGKITK
ncbi:hypothetical protein [Sulfurospirillum cavolei]|uniref:hypothetical protein n=1 Tax=Sulfurospirillum cavolei TaxID=366522 RepID=UPI003FA26C78